MTLIPSYGRDYPSAKAVRADWAAGKDFTIADMSSPDDGRQINIADARIAKLASVNIRYKRLTQIAVVKVTP